jgi:uncharacterized membrane protein YagU involved in acid resistance
MAQTAETALPPMTHRPSRVAMAALVGGLLAGVQDLFGASIIYKIPLLTIMRAVGAGLLGREQIKTGGMTESMIGLACHLTIAVAAAAVYVLASRRLPILLRQPLIMGALFGAAVFVFMNCLVVPLSAAAPPHPNLLAPFDWIARPAKGLDFLSNVLFGVIIAVTASLMLKPRRT